MQHRHYPVLPISPKCNDIFFTVEITIWLCCTVQAHSHEVAELIGSVGGSLNGITGTVGINCVHIGAATSSCTAQTACCTGDQTVSRPKFMIWRFTHVSCSDWRCSRRMQSHQSLIMPPSENHIRILWIVGEQPTLYSILWTIRQVSLIMFLSSDQRKMREWGDWENFKFPVKTVEQQ